MSGFCNKHYVYNDAVSIIRECFVEARFVENKKRKINSISHIKLRIT